MIGHCDITNVQQPIPDQKATDVNQAEAPTWLAMEFEPMKWFFTYVSAMRCAQSGNTIGCAARMFGWCGSWGCCSSQRERRRSKISIQAAGVGVAISQLRTSKNAELSTCNLLNCPCCVQRRCVVFSPLAKSLAIAANNSGSGRRYRGSYAHRGSVLMKIQTAAVKRRTSKMSMLLSLAFQTTHGRGPGAEEGNLHCEAGEQRRQRGPVHRS